MNIDLDCFKPSSRSINLYCFHMPLLSQLDILKSKWRWFFPFRMQEVSTEKQHIKIGIFVCVCGDRYFLRFFRKCTIFKVFIEFLQYSFCYKTETIFLVFWPQGVWDLSSLTRDQVCVPCIGRWSLNHWTASEVPKIGISNQVLLITFPSDFSSSSLFNYQHYFSPKSELMFSSR